MEYVCTVVLINIIDLICSQVIGHIHICMAFNMVQMLCWKVMPTFQVNKQIRAILAFYI